MDCAYSRDDEHFRDEVRTFFAENLPNDLRRAAKRMTSVYASGEIMRQWQSILHRKGWVAPAWPVEYGGCGWPPLWRYIYTIELARAGAPPLSPMGLQMCGPVLIGHGTAAQKAFYLPRILSGEDFWCQGYSEPSAGSDLASLQMRAEDDGNEWICNGQKIWTTHAQLANRIFCLVRTGREAQPQRGITFLLIDMHSPGVEVRPITMLSGEQIQCEIFFRNVRVSKSNAVGRPGDGWSVAKYLLQFERGGAYAAPGLWARLERMRELAKLNGSIDSGGITRQLSELESDIWALEFTELRVMADARRGAVQGMDASALKVRSTELSQRLTEIGLDVGGYYTFAFQPWQTSPGGRVVGGSANAPNPIGPLDCASIASRYLNERAGSIYAGSNEIQRNIMAKEILERV